MLKIWLTWLQPRLGLFGTALILCNPLYSYAAPKSAAISNTSKIATQPSQSTGAVPTGTTIEQELLSAIAPPPDRAVRQLAINSMTTGSVQAKSFTTTTPQHQHQAFTRLASSATRSQKLSARATKPHQLKHSVAKALARSIYPQTTTPIPGLVIGNTDIHTSTQFLPNLKPIAQSMSSGTEIGAPTSLSAMMAAKPIVSPFPVVRPELMEKLQKAPAIASFPTIKTAPYALNPIAEIPTGRLRAVTPKTIGLKAAPIHSLDPIAAIPSGLQRLLGNNLNIHHKVAVAPVVKKIATNPSSLVALKSFVAPTNAIAPTSVSGASLQLATAQAYTSVPKFDIPGEKLLTVKPAVNLLVVKPVQKSLLTMVMGRKSNYVALMSDRQLTPATKQSWNLVNQRNNLGGLILGSQALATVSNSKSFSLLPTTTPTNSSSVGLPVRNLANFN